MSIVLEGRMRKTPLTKSERADLEKKAMKIYGLTRKEARELSDADVEYFSVEPSGITEAREEGGWVSTDDWNDMIVDVEASLARANVIFAKHGLPPIQ